MVAIESGPSSPFLKILAPVSLTETLRFASPPAFAATGPKHYPFHPASDIRR